MTLMVLDNIGSFSLVPHLKMIIPKGEIFSMVSIDSDNFWDIFKSTNPDTVFVDFCNENAVDLTKRVKELPNKPRIVIRLHGYEVQSWYMEAIDWSQVDVLIVVSPKFKEIVRSKNIILGSRVNVVYNGIDLNKFKLQDDSLVDNKSIAYAGYLNKKKGPSLLRTVMFSMPDRRFYVASQYQDEHVELYFEDLDLPNVSYLGWGDTSQLLQGRRYILSTSVTESFGMSIGEGMAMGLTPLVHHWPGADLLWPKECLWKSFDELKAIKPKDPVWCRKWIEDRYSMKTCIDQVLMLLLK